MEDMTKEDHAFREWINPRVQNHKERTQLLFGKTIRHLVKKGWTQMAINNWILTKTLERLITGFDNANFKDNQLENKFGRCEVCDSLEECTCFCKCGLPHDQCMCDSHSNDKAKFKGDSK